jgi:transposase
MRKARTPTQLGLTVGDRRRLARAMRHADDVRFFRRLQAVFLSAQGRAVQDIALITGLSRKGVYRWLNRYRQRQQVNALRDRPRAGRPRSVRALTDARLVQEFRRDPLRLGYNSTGWTVALLASHLSRKYRCSISPWTLRRRMRRLTLRWKRPRYVYATKDPHRAQKKGGLFAA